MRTPHSRRTACIEFCLIYATLVCAQDRSRALAPEAQVYATNGGVALYAYMFRPAPARAHEPLPTIVLFHGGGWTMGEASWTFGRARHFAARGMIAVAAQYRLSNQSTVTPLVGAQLFYERMHAAGNRCELQIYDGVGHLFTPANMRDDGWPQPDQKTQTEAFQKADAFLRALGFMKQEARSNN